MSQVSPGWYRDPSGRFAQRYHDGSRWTEHVADAHGNRDTDAPVGQTGPGLICGLGAALAALRPGWSALVRPLRAAVGGRRPRLWRAICEEQYGQDVTGSERRHDPGVGLGAWLRPVGGAGTGLGPGAAGLQPGPWRPAATRAPRRAGIRRARGVGSPRAADRRPATSGPRAPAQLSRVATAGPPPGGPATGSGLASGRPGPGAGAVRRRSALSPDSGIRAARGRPRSRLRLRAVWHVPRVHADDRPHRRRRRRRAVAALVVRAELPRAQLSGSQPFGLAGRHRRRLRRRCPGSPRHLCGLWPVPGRPRRRACPPWPS